MAKVQGKKKAASPSRRAAGKVAARVKSAARAIKKTASRKSTSATSSRKSAPARRKPEPTKPVKAVKRAAAALPSRPVAVPPEKPKAPVARHTPPVPAPAEAEAPKKGRARRGRARVHSNGAPVANWLPPGAEKPRPSSFIPAPARAEAPSRVAAPPASSDRLIRPEDVTEFVTRTVPVRIDIEQGGGRVLVSVNPEEVFLKVGEGIEWDFRYLGGADVTVDELVIEFDKPSPFTHQSFRSRKPGPARPHRQLSGAIQKSAAGKRIAYTIRALSPYRVELAVAKPHMTVSA